MGGKNPASVEIAEDLYRAVRELLPTVMLHKRSKRTASIYLRSPDGRMIRISDHDSRQIYAKWQLCPELPAQGRWKCHKQQIGAKTYHFNVFQTSNPEVLVKQIKAAMNKQLRLFDNL